MNQPSIFAIQAVVAEGFGVSVLDLLSRRVARQVALPRQVAMWIARHQTLHSLPEIGRAFGGRDHSTVMHAIARVDELMAADSALAERVRLCSEGGNMSNHGYSKFWWQDWQGDSSLRSCCLAARGLWMELLCVAHSGSPVGHVTLNGKAATNRQLAAIVGTTEKELARLIAELESAGVFSRTDTGEIFSRRMVRDVSRSDEGAAHASKRWGNGRATGHPNGGANGSPTTNPITPYSESESEAPPRRSPEAGGPARRGSKPSRNAFHDAARQFDAEMADRHRTIDGTAENVADFGGYLRQVGGRHG